MVYISTVLQQLQRLLPMHEFDSFEGQHEADKWRKTFKTRDQLKIMMYAQATQKRSLRDIEIGLRVLYHLGIKTVGKSTLARANEAVPYDIFESLFYKLLEKCQNFSSGTASSLNSSQFFQ
jgi:hypothetical protein